MSESVKFPEFEGFDANGLLGRLRGKVERVAHILNSFSTNYANASEDLEKLVQEGSSEEAQRLLHSLKGVTGNLFMTELYDFIVVFEGDMKEGKMDNFADQQAQFKQLIDRTLEQISQVESVINSL